MNYLFTLILFMANMAAGLSEPVQQSGFQYAYGYCHDGSKFYAPETSSSDTPCYTASELQKLASQQCQRKCNKNASKCGVNSYAAGPSCKILPPPLKKADANWACGDGKYYIWNPPSYEGSQKIDCNDLKYSQERVKESALRLCKSINGGGQLLYFSVDTFACTQKTKPLK